MGDTSTPESIFWSSLGHEEKFEKSLNYLVKSQNCITRCIDGNDMFHIDTLSELVGGLMHTDLHNRDLADRSLSKIMVYGSILKQDEELSGNQEICNTVYLFCDESLMLQQNSTTFIDSVKMTSYLGRLCSESQTTDFPDNLSLEPIPSDMRLNVSHVIQTTKTIPRCKRFMVMLITQIQREMEIFRKQIESTEAGFFKFIDKYKDNIGEINVTFSEDFFSFNMSCDQRSSDESDSESEESEDSEYSGDEVDMVPVYSTENGELKCPFCKRATDFTPAPPTQHCWICEILEDCPPPETSSLGGCECGCYLCDNCITRMKDF